MLSLLLMSFQSNQRTMYWDYDAFITCSQGLHMYLECYQPKLNHDDIIEGLMMAIIA